MEYEKETLQFSKSAPRNVRLVKAAIVALAVIGVVCLIVGIVLIAVGATRKQCPSVQSQTSDSFCGYSDEAKRVGFDQFIDRVKKTYYEVHPFVMYDDPGVRQSSDQEDVVRRVKTEYVAYDTTPSVLKKRTDTALKMLDELNGLDFAEEKLKPRERKAVLQLKHFLQQIFGQPYESNYYTGDWMLGPGMFGFRSICRMGYNLINAMRYHKPKSLKDVELIQTKLVTHQKAVERYIENMKMGVLKGMVRNVEACQVGIHFIKREYYNISMLNETGVWKEWYTQEMLSSAYYSNITTAMNEQWKKSHNNTSVEESIKSYLLEYIGKPITGLFRYLEEEHLRHCVPSAVSSGLGSLPVKYVYTDGTPNTSWPTDPTLPMTDKVLDGKKAYELILSYFTTNTDPPSKVHKLGYDMLAVLYPQAVQVAREVTKIYNDNVTAVQEFRKLLNSSKMYFNEDPIPANESDENAFRKCSNLKGAEKYCPRRWEALQKWFKEARQAMSMLDPKIVNMFYFTGEKDTAPNCPIDLEPDLNPSSGIQTYTDSTQSCTKPASYNLPFFLKDLGPRYSEWSINAHEARPGHHVQIQGNIENFQDSCSGSIAWLNTMTYYTAFTEGWALYAENPLIAEDTDTYKNEPMQKYGMLKWQIWRAIRLIVDTGLHYTGMTRAEALELFDEKAWDATDFAEKEVTRYQSIYGQATAYMIGQLDIKKARKYATDALGSKFDLKEFHYQVLSQGSSPLAYLSDHIHRYVDCKKAPSKTGCGEILNPPKKMNKENKLANPNVYPPVRHYL
ncbi:hypothetical protein QZH41_019871 [Actinostola sp. cb2023]|nr:hypothetical protein QZH41_019871 [Actinostola sp. cb2023]